MCGFTGYFDFNGPATSASETIREMLNLQKHRGPDDSGVVGIDTFSGFYQSMNVHTDNKFDKPVNLVLGFNRLSILDLSPNGHQPMFSPDGRWILMMNGEIYNAFDFKSGLLAAGHSFRGESDTEVVVHLLMEYGFDRTVRLLNGMFAMVVYDLSERLLYVVRDRFGIKPLYVMKEPNRLAFSSEMKSFKALPDFRFELDRNQIDEYLLFRNVINRTLFQNICNLVPGTYYCVDHQGTIRELQYYNIEEEGKSRICQNEAYQLIENTLQKSISSQMMSDVKLGCQLSGGVDSSLVTYYASSLVDKGKLETVSIVFDSPEYSEKQWIDEVSSNLNLQSHLFTLNPQYYLNHLSKATWHYEQPVNHPNTIGIYKLSEEAKKYVTVLLSGEGADECLAGYSRFCYDTKFLPLRQIASFCKRDFRDPVDLLTYCSQWNLRTIMSTAMLDLSTAYRLYPQFSFSRAISQRRDIFHKLTGDKMLKHRKYELLTYLPDLLMRQDKMSMAHSIENRVPFLDNKMVSAALSLSVSNLWGKENQRLEGKMIIKQICSDKFSKRFAFRNKMGFGIPLGKFMQDRFFTVKWEEEILPGIKQREIFDSSMLPSHLHGLSSRQLNAVWVMSAFEIWAQQYLD